MAAEAAKAVRCVQNAPGSTPEELYDVRPGQACCTATEAGGGCHASWLR